MESSEAAVDAELVLANETAREQQQQHQQLQQRHLSKRSEKRHEQTYHETSPLLPAGSSQHTITDNDIIYDSNNNGGDIDNDGDGIASNGEDEWEGSRDLAHLPWYRRPSILWLIGPFFIMACAFGGIITPKLNLILELVCRDYVNEQMATRPGFWMAPVDFNNGDNDQCRIPEVQARVTKFTLWTNLIAGLLSAITSPKMGALSDRYGRKVILIATSIGTILGEVITIAAATYPETFPINLLLLSFALDGLTGSHIVAMSVSTAYATDCTPPRKRHMAFGFFHGCLFTGIAIGPIITGYVVKWTGQIAVAFWLMTGVHLAYMLFVLLFVPESLSKKRQMEAREKHRREQTVLSDWFWPSQLRSLNFLEPLKIMWPKGAGASSALRRNLLLMSTVDTLMYGVAMGTLNILVYYTNYQFGWQTFETGRFVTIVSSSRVFSLLVILPLLIRLFRGKQDPTQQAKHVGASNFDLYTIRVAVLIDTIGCLGYTLSRDGALFTLSGAVAALGGLASPMLQATITKHVPLDRTGQILGAIGLLHALARVFAPMVFSAIYFETVATFPQTVFLCLCITFGIASILSWFIRPHVYFDEKAALLAEEEPDRSVISNESGEGNSTPIFGAITAAVLSFAVALGLRSGG